MKNFNIQIKYRFIIYILLIAILSNSCKSAKYRELDFDDFYNKYQDDNGVVSLKIPLLFAKMLLSKEDKNVIKRFGKLQKARLFLAKKNAKEYAKIIKPYLSATTYENLLTINNDNDLIIFKMKKPKEGNVKEIVMTISSDDKFITLCFNGNFTFTDAKKISQAINYKGVNDL